MDMFWTILLVFVIILLCGMVWIYKEAKLQHGKSLYVILWNVSLSLLGICFVLLSGELYFRNFVDTTDSFGLSKLTKRWMERHIELNNLYARDNINYTLKKPDGKRRLTFIGDSFTAGHGIKDVDDRFVNIIRKNHPQWEIHNFARPGFESIDQLQLYDMFKAEGYYLDIVVLVYNLNDIAPEIESTEIIYDDIFEFEEKLGWVFQKSYFLNYLAFRYHVLNNKNLAKYYDYVKEGYFGKDWTDHASTLNRIIQKTSEQGSRLLVITFPFMHKFDSGYTFQNVHKKLDVFWKENKVVHLDLLPSFEGFNSKKLQVNKYDAHPNETAHEIAASAIERFLMNELNER